MAISLKENNWFFVMDQTPPPIKVQFFKENVARAGQWSEPWIFRLFFTCAFLITVPLNHAVTQFAKYATEKATYVI
jgi:hypothetical protein